MYYLKLYAGWLAVLFFAVCIADLVAGVSNLNEDGEVKNKKLEIFYSIVGTIGIISTLLFGITRWVASTDYSIVVSSQTINVLKVSDLSPGGDLSDGSAYVEYLSHNIYKADDYNGPVTVSTTVKVATIDIQTRKNIYGGRETVLNDLLVPESYVK